MFAYDLNTVELFNSPNWGSSLHSTQEETNQRVLKKVPIPSPIAPPKLPPSAFTQVSSGEMWDVSSSSDWKSSPTKKSQDELQMTGIEQDHAKQNLYKTEMCRNFKETGHCRYGYKCQFAHGEDELRGILRHPKYKTEICRSYHTTGSCMYGKRCRFVHHANEMRTPEGDKMNDSNYSFQRQLAQLKFVDLMPSPDQSLFSSPGTIPQEWFIEVEKLMGDLSLNNEHIPQNNDTSRTLSNDQTEKEIESMKVFEPQVARFEEEEPSSESADTEDQEKLKKTKPKFSFFSKLYKSDKKRSY